MKRSITAVAGGLAVALLVSACGGGNPLSTPSATPGPSGTITVGSADFPESQLIAEIYAQALAAKGITTTKKLSIGTREVYIRALQDGSIDLVPEYTGNLLTYFKPGATETSSDAVYAALPAALPPGLVVLDKSSAEDKDAFVVTQATAQQYNAKSIADIAPNCAQLVFGGPAEFAQRAYGIAGLQRNYNCTFKEFKPLAGPLTVTSLKDGSIQGANIFTTTSAIKANGFVVLEDPKNNFAAQNVLPLARASKINDNAKQVLNAISAKLTTQALLDLNARLDGTDKPNPEVVAKEWLTANGLA